MFKNAQEKDAALMTRQYKKVNDQQRQTLISFYEETQSVKIAAKMLRITYENAKVIIRTYKHEGRATKKITQNRLLKQKGNHQQSRGLANTD